MCKHKYWCPWIYTVILLKSSTMHVSVHFTCQHWHTLTLVKPGKKSTKEKIWEKLSWKNSASAWQLQETVKHFGERPTILLIMVFMLLLYCQCTYILEGLLYTNLAIICYANQCSYFQQCHYCKVNGNVLKYKVVEIDNVSEDQEKEQVFCLNL